MTDQGQDEKPQNPLPYSTSGGGMPARVNPDEIFKKIDQVRDGLRNDLEPSVLSQIFSRSQRERARALAEARTSAIRARKELIDGLADAIKIYVDVHKGDLKVRGEAFIVATFTEMFQNLNRAMESTYVAFLETYSQSFDRIQAIRNLTDEQKTAQIHAAYERSEAATEHGRRTFNSILDTLRDQVIKIVTEVGE